MESVERDAFVALLRSRGSERLRGLLPHYDLEMILGRGGCAVHEGNLTSAAHWRLPADNLLVLGSVTCDGLVDLAPEVGGDWGGSLWALGGLSCRSFAGHYGASLVVDGDFTVRELAVAAFEDALLVVTGDFTARFFYGLDIWANVGGRAAMEYGDGYALPLGYDDPEAQAVMPRRCREASLALLNLDGEEGGEELAARLRRGEHFRGAGA